MAQCERFGAKPKLKPARPKAANTATRGFRDRKISQKKQTKMERKTNSRPCDPGSDMVYPTGRLTAGKNGEGTEQSGQRENIPAVANEDQSVTDEVKARKKITVCVPNP